MMYSWKKDLFDSTIFNFPVAKIDTILFDKDENNVKKLIVDLKNNDICYATYRVSANEFQIIHQLERAGFILVDGLIGLICDLKALSSIENTEQIRVATIDDLARLKELASQVFYLNRLYNDPFIGVAKANLFYATWIENSLLGKVADKVYIWEEEATILGFVTMKLDGNIPLLGVRKGDRGKGISRKLVNTVLSDLYSHNITQAIIETQIGNIPAIRSYQSCGFKVSETHLTFSWHKDE